MENYYKSVGAAGQRLHDIGKNQYGATIAPKMNRRVPLNCAAILLCLLMPWVLFAVMYAVMAFSIRYEHKVFAYFLVFLGLVIVIMTVKLAIDAVSKQRSEGSDATWFIFLAAACAIAWGAGVILGDLNYFYNMEPFYDVRNLNFYPNVDPSRTSGQQVMDAGRITFAPGSGIDFAKSMAFRSADLYCVAPVVNTMGNTTGSSYDFWAVGLNCCKGPGAFMCGEYTNVHASSGLRVLRDDQCAFYRLAVQQAEATHNIKANHPLFLYWMQDPNAEVNAYRDEGLKYFVFGLFAFFAFMLASIIAAIVFSSTSNIMKEYRRHSDKTAPMQAFLPPPKEVVTSQPSSAKAMPFPSSPPFPSTGFGGAPVAMQPQSPPVAMYDNSQVTMPRPLQAAPLSQVPLSGVPSMPVRSSIIPPQAAPPSPAPSDPRSRSSSPRTFVQTSAPRTATPVITSELQPGVLPSSMPKVTDMDATINVVPSSAVRSRSV